MDRQGLFEEDESGEDFDFFLRRLYRKKFYSVDDINHLTKALEFLTEANDGLCLNLHQALNDLYTLEKRLSWYRKTMALKLL